jgi:hypothetical protein
VLPETQGGVVQKVDRAKPTTPRVNSSLLRPEYLIHLVDVSVQQVWDESCSVDTRSS